MRLMKLASLAMMATFMLGAYSARAAITTVTNYSKLSVSGTVITNAASFWKGNIEKYPTGKYKIGNKQLLDLFAHWDGASRTTEPWKSARLVVGWSQGWDGDVLVVDKTGTNVLFDADYNMDAYFYVDFSDENGAYNQTYKDTSPGYWTWTDWNTAYFELFDDYYYLPYTYFQVYGGNTQTFKQSWDRNGNYSTWSDSESAKFPYNGDQYFLDYGSDTTVSGSISTSGHGKGLNSYFY